MNNVKMKNVELYGNLFDGLTFRLPVSDAYFIYEYVSVINDNVVFMDFYYKSSNELNSRGNEKFYFDLINEEFMGGI